MNKNDILEKITNKKAQDYSFLVLFFLIFSVFVYFAIRPNLVTAFNLQQELEELRFQDQLYESTIIDIVEYQTLLEETRDDFVLLDEAVPKEPDIYSLVDDIREAAEESDIPVKNLRVSEVVFKEGELSSEQIKRRSEQNALKKGDIDYNSYIIEFTIDASFTESRDFIARTIAQRRLKVVNSITLNTGSQAATRSAEYSVSIEVEGYYL